MFALFYQHIKAKVSVLWRGSLKAGKNVEKHVGRKKNQGSWARGNRNHACGRRVSRAIAEPEMVNDAGGKEGRRVQDAFLGGFGG